MNATTLEPAIEEETLPPRRRRFVFGRAAIALTGVLILALGFIGGVEVQKNQGTAASAAPTSAAGARAGGFAGRRFPLAAGGGASDVVTGTVANKKGRYIYVKDADGNTIRVKTSSNSTISRN